jgi:transcriptional regulator with GAF, ATPase, and Fis domain
MSMFPSTESSGGAGRAMLGARMSEHEQRFELLADLGAMIAGEVELDDMLATFADRVARALGADRATLWLIDSETGEIRSRVAILPELPELRVPPGHGVVGYVVATGQVVNLRDPESDPRWGGEDIAQRIGYRTTSMLTAPIVRREQIRGVLQVLNKQEGAFTSRDEEFLRVLAEQIGRALDYTTLRGDDAQRGLVLRGRFNHVIGRSPAMAAVYEMIGRAAQTDATVLLHGETGTGKGLLARAIHVNSRRREAPFVHVDCTTLPAALVESELFGHERGAYTGADSRVIGKVEAAHGGTLFLDEIGELPLPLQGKLLRFVQERRFERVGGRETLAADVRLVAATNRDLAAMSAAGQFRSDLYFRLRVVEIEIPTLRARGGDDVVDLASHFIDQMARRYRKGTLRLDEAAKPALAAYPWPGNVRELENTIERAVVLCQGSSIMLRDLGLEPRRTTGVLAAVSASDSMVGMPAFGSNAAIAVPPAVPAAPAAPLSPAAAATFAAPGATAPGAAAAPAANGAPVSADSAILLPPDLSLEEAERRYARAILERAGNNQSAAARALGISRNKLARLLRG